MEPLPAGEGRRAINRPATKQRPIKSGFLGRFLAGFIRRCSLAQRFIAARAAKFSRVAPAQFGPNCLPTESSNVRSGHAWRYRINFFELHYRRAAYQRAKKTDWMIYGEVGMSLPGTLVSAIKAAHEAMSQNSQFDLDLGYRHSIWAALGPRASSQVPKPSGLRRRATLAILSARYVIPIWESVWPGDNTPHRILVEAGQVLDGLVEPQTADRDFGKFWTYMDSLASRLKNSSAVMVGYSAAKALCAALFDEKFDPFHINYELTDADVDPYDSDAAFAAAAAYAGGAIWNTNSISSKRREFWEWWLDEAVPAAWNSVSDAGR